RPVRPQDVRPPRCGGEDEGARLGFAAAALRGALRARQQLGLALAPDALGDLVGIVGSRRIAAAVAQAQVLDQLVARFAGKDALDLRPLVVSPRQVEADRTAAAAAVAVALAQRRDALLQLLVLPKRPGAHISGDERTSHMASIAAHPHQRITARKNPVDRPPPRRTLGRRRRSATFCSLQRFDRVTIPRSSDMDSKLLTAALFGAALAFSTAPASAQLVGSMVVPAAGSHGFRGVRPSPHNFN